MRITFLLPGQSLKPTGGFKVIYEYANRLVARGQEVSVVHPWELSSPGSLRERVQARFWVAKLRARPAALAPWFDLDQRVALEAVTDPAVSNLPAADVLVATAWHTAPWVNDAVPEKGAGFYLIQGYETWDGAVDRVQETWRLPLQKVVISGWLEEIAAELGEGERTSRVPIGMDLDRLGVDVPREQRGRRIGALYSSAPEKRSADAIAAMRAVKNSDPSVSAVMFGTAPRPAGLAGWIEYEMLPSPEQLRALYNSCAVFLQTSRSEGWGLPACEAMLCGCALVTVANGGSREFAIDDETAVVVAPEAAGELADRVAALLGDGERQLRLARAGEELLRAYTWERSVTELEGVLESAVKAASAR